MRGRRSGLKWICATVAPWALGVGLLVSFTASAGTDLQSGVSALEVSPVALLADAGSLIPAAAESLGIRPFLAPLGRPDGVRSAALGFDLPEEVEQLLDAEPLRDEAKGETERFPQVERSSKADPTGVVPASLSRLGSGRTGLGAGLVFRRDGWFLPPSPIEPGPLQAPDMAAIGALEPWHDDGTTTLHASSIQSPAAAAAGSTGSGRSATTPSSGGESPRVPRAMALSSATPAPADAVPLEIAAVPVLPRGGLPESGSAVDHGEAGGPRYAELIDPDHMAREQRCLAEAVYFEARSEPEEGQAAVAQVVLNRVGSGLYPSTICGVVYQNRHRHLACQFTFACEGKSLRIGESESWERAKRVAQEVLEGRTYLAEVGGATHYHANYVRPSWARRLKKMDTIGRHIFYKLKPGQT